MSKPRIDYTLQIHKRDEHGNYYIDSPDLPGLMLYGPVLSFLLSDVPLAVSKLRERNSAPDSKGEHRC